MSIIDYRWSEGQGVEGPVWEDESFFVSSRLLKCHLGAKFQTHCWYNADFAWLELLPHCVTIFAGVVVWVSGPYRFIFLNAWSSVSGTAWEGLKRATLLEEVLLGVGFEVSKGHTRPSLSFFLPAICRWYELSATASEPCLPACCHTPALDDLML